MFMHVHVQCKCMGMGMGMGMGNYKYKYKYKYKQYKYKRSTNNEKVMRKLVVIDLTSADTDLFESYEREVIPLLSKYEGQLELSVRSLDGLTETHLLYFPDEIHFERFLSDPTRMALKDKLRQTGVISTTSDVEKVDYH